jgi:fatty acid synthase subunit alpha
MSLDASAVGVLQSEEWFDWDNDAKPLLPGTKLIFRVQMEVAYKNKTTYSSVNVTGKVYVRDQLKTPIPVATIDYTNGVSVGNPVTAYLQRHRVAQDQPVPFDNACTLTKANAPTTNEPYSQISGDYNPIYINSYFSDFAFLLGTITHAMWSSAATCKYVETVVAQGKPDVSSCKFFFFALFEGDSPYNVF